MNHKTKQKLKDIAPAFAIAAFLGAAGIGHYVSVKNERDDLREQLANFETANDVATLFAYAETQAARVKDYCDDSVPTFFDFNSLERATRSQIEQYGLHYQRGEVDINTRLETLQALEDAGILFTAGSLPRNMLAAFYNDAEKGNVFMIDDFILGSGGDYAWSLIDQLISGEIGQDGQDFFVVDEHPVTGSDGFHIITRAQGQETAVFEQGDYRVPITMPLKPC